MAKNINAKNVTRGNVFFIPPEELIVVEGDNARRYDSAAEVDLAVDLIDHGQIVPIICRRNEQDRPVVVDGRRRVKALCYINEEKLYDRENGRVKARCEIIDSDEDKEAFLISLKTFNRKDLSPIDHLHNIRKLEQYGMTREEIARLHGKSQPWVSKIIKLEKLPARVQRQVHEGKISSDAAYELADLPQEEVAAAVEEAKQNAEQGSQRKGKTGETVTGKEAVRKTKRSREAAGAGAEDSGPKKRTLKEIRMFFLDLDNSVGPARGPVEEFAGEFLKFMDGKMSDAVLTSRLRKLAESGGELYT